MRRPRPSRRCARDRDRSPARLAAAAATRIGFPSLRRHSGSATAFASRRRAWAGCPALGDLPVARIGITALCLRFVILTACRSGEARGMIWSEVDLDGAVWHVPARRMKAGRPHRVPLAPAAIALLRALRPEKPAADAVVFPGPRKGKPLSDMALSMLRAA